MFVLLQNNYRGPFHSLFNNKGAAERANLTAEDTIKHQKINQQNITKSEGSIYNI